MTEYIPTIGLEIHAELKTQTKMFCNSKNDPDEKRPNWNVCPVCMAHPGTLPVINREAVKHVLKVGVAVGGTIADYTEFDRKNYFYPDIPKGYQISQYAYPLVKGGALNGIALTRIHLEEDTARSIHIKKGNSELEKETYDAALISGEIVKENCSLVDFNRAGVPLMELVTEPVTYSTREEAAKKSGDFGREFQKLLRTLNVSDADMEKGHLRLEANISISKTKTLGTKVEIKNINSFRVLEHAIRSEIKRQEKILDGGEKIVQETRGVVLKRKEGDDHDVDVVVTAQQRKKESSHDYRYFPEPDLPKLVISEIPEFSVEALKKEIPELPWQKRERYLTLGLKKEDADMFVANTALGNFADEFLQKTKEDQKFSVLGVNIIATNLASLTNNPEETKLTPNRFFELIEMRNANETSSTATREILETMLVDDKPARKIAEEKGLLQKSDEGAIGKIVDEVIAQNESVVTEYKKGKEASLQFLVGQGMKLSKGSANPGVLAKLLKEKLS